MMKCRKKRDLRHRAAKIACQYAARKVSGGSDLPTMSAAHLALQDKFGVSGDELLIAKLAFSKGLISRARMKKLALFSDQELDALVGRSRAPYHAQISEAQIQSFYTSREWRQLAYKMKLRDGRRCHCCGATPSDGARIVSDHVMPIRSHWHLRLDPGNVQTLCDECNLGKGSWDSTRFFKADAEAVA